MKINEVLAESEEVDEINGHCEYFCREIDKKQYSIDVIDVHKDAIMYITSLSGQQLFLLDIEKPKYYDRLLDLLNMRKT